MIPTRLTLRNFMCYRGSLPPLDFDGIHVACLCGDNGSGKSAIFDAITWSLWGKSRARSDDDLICLGQNEMEVELEFNANGLLYRIIRKHVRSTYSRSGQPMLELQIKNNGSFKSITEPNRTETQRKIIGLLHLDYQAFINSAMLLQGRSNEFTTKRPAERKEILADILDLSFYEGIEKEAKQVSEKRKYEEDTTGVEINIINSKIGKRIEYEDELTTIIGEINAMEKTVAELNGDISSLRQQKDALMVKQQQMSLYREQLQNLEQDLRKWQKRLIDHNKNIEKYNSILSQQDTVKEKYAEYLRVTASDEQMNSKLKQLLALLEQKEKLEKLIASAMNTFSSERKLLQSQISELEIKSQNLPKLQETLAGLFARQAEHEDQEIVLENKRKLINELTAAISSTAASNSELSKAIEDLKLKIGMISHAGAKCPLCETDLGTEGRNRLDKKFKAEMQQNITLHGQNLNTISHNRAELSALDKEIKQIELTVRSESDKVKRLIAVTEKEIAEAKVAEAQLSPRRKKLHQLDDDIRNNNYAPDEQKTLVHLKEQQEKLGYEKDIHDQLKKRKDELWPYEDLHRQLNDALQRFKSEKTAAADAEKEISILRQKSESLALNCQTLNGELAILPGLTVKLEALTIQHTSALQQERAVRDKQAELKEKIRQLDILAVEKEDREKRMQLTKEEARIYADLAAAFGKKGIQALLIESALPEIEEEANILLGKLTDNRMSLSLETQRDTKKGDTVETLDIKISDELGTRNYEMYSGGEAFRIDLSLRIAISRLLVRRAGASMPVLIIDEGFGTQDAASLERLVDAINSIQDDFEKIIVITHLGELKDKFPVLINVVKTTEGSTFTINS